MAISRINPSTLLNKVRLLMRVADLSKPVSLTFIGLSTNASWFADERKTFRPRLRQFRANVNCVVGLVDRIVEKFLTSLGKQC